MKYINVGIFQDDRIGKDLGKRESETDIVMHSRKTDNCIYTFLQPRDDRLETKAEIMSVIDAAIISFENITPSLGETVLMLDAFGISEGVAVVPPYAELNRITAITKGTSLESYHMKKNDPAEIMEVLSALSPKRDSSSAPAIRIDQAFSVRGVGEVALGFVTMGTVRKFDKLEILPGNREVIIRSIQVHDKDVGSAEAGVRIGIAVKGAESKDMGRGCIICGPGQAECGSRIELSFTRNRFYSGEISGRKCHATVGMETVPVSVECRDGSKVIITSEKPVAYTKYDRFILIDMNAKTVHLIGYGKPA